MEDLSFLKKSRMPHGTLITRLCNRTDITLTNENINIKDFDDLYE